jgi:hypothetical protein
MILAALALVFAMAGTAIAGPDAISSAITKSKVKKIAKKQINKAAPGLSVAHADTATNADHATNADNATNADHATNADNADNAINALAAIDAQNAVNAQTAANADNATNAQNADALGGIAASSYMRGFFAKVAYSDANPTILAGSPGVSTSGEGALGFPRLTFPQSMNNCAITAMTSSNAGTSIVRHSTAAGGTLVQLAIQDGANAATRVNFSIIAVC